MHEGSIIGRQLQYFKDNIDKPLAAILTLNTFAHTVGAIGVGKQATLIWYDSSPVITGIVVPVVMTLAILILSEIIPKTIGANFWEKLASFTVLSLTILIKLLYPLVLLCQLITKVFRDKNDKSIFTRVDFETLAEIGETQGVLNAEESNLIENTLDLYELKVTEVMRPAEDMVTVAKDESIDNLLALINKYRFSRYPVIDSANNEIIGIIHVKDLFKKNKINEYSSINDIIRPILKVKANLPVNNLLRRFREGQPHFALVYQGNQKILGFITLDNVLQVLIGIIKDEFNRTHVDWKINPDGTISATGFCSIYALEQALDIDIEVDESIDTISGLILHTLERMPEIGEVIQFADFELKIEEIENARITKVTVYKKL